MRCRIYTDGSYNNNSNIGSWCIVIVNHNKIKVKTGVINDTTNNQVELIAVLNALEYVERKHIKDVEILTDSLYVINGVTKHLDKWIQHKWLGCSKKSIKYKKIWEEIKMLLDCIKEERYNVKFTKVRSHSNNSLNELADTEAKKAILKYKEKTNDRLQ